jgi:hypothetical protein
MGMFSGATAFNQPIGSWVVSKSIFFVSTLEAFESLKRFSSFVRSVKKDTTVLTALHISPFHFHFLQFNMFSRATAFNQDLSGWDVSKSTRFVSSLEVFESVLTALHVSPSISLLAG